MSKICLLLILIYVISIYPQEILTGTLMGKVIDAENKLPLPGVNVYLKDQNRGAVTDLNGNYNISNLPVNSYSIVYSYIGYKSFTASDIIIRSNRITYQDVELFASGVVVDSVVVTGGYFSNIENKPVSTIEFSAEEIRRAPGSVGDVSRILFGLPSVAKTNDGKNSLMVRGGSPVENSFYVDNIEINNINHFATQGSSDGLFGIINIDFVKDVTFNAGGFSPLYGDKLSSVMEISLREGNRNTYDAQANLNFGGIGAQFEGPFAGEKGTFLISANKSYLDLLMNTFAKGYPAPEYYDAQTKVTYDLSDNHKLSFIDIFANDIYDVAYSDALDTDLNQFGNTKYVTNTAGLNWKYIWGEIGFSSTSVSNTINNHRVFLNETKSGNKFLSIETMENNFVFRNLNYLKFNDEHKLEFGVESKFGINNFDYTLFEYVDEYGNEQPTSAIIKKLNTFKAGAFIFYHYSPFQNMTIKIGGRGDYFDHDNSFVFSPRGDITYRFNQSTTLSASCGIFYQDMPGLILAQSEEFKNLDKPEAVHYILSLSKLISEETMFTLELYLKEYSNLPVDPSRPEVLLFDDVTAAGFFACHNKLLSTGTAESKGIEAMLQKKLAENFYGIISASYSSAKYKDMSGTWRNRIYDNRFNFNIEGGYKPNNEWEFSLRFIYAGGTPYTPFNIQLSKQYDTGVLNINKINGSRLPDYNSLNIRVDKRFYFSGSNLVVFLSIWNVYNRDNVSAYTWNEIKNQSAEEIGWNTIPVFGIEFEF